MGVEYLQDKISEAINRKFKEVASRLWEKHEREFLDELEKEKSRIISKLIIEIQSFVRFQDKANELVVTIVKRKEKES